MLLTSVTSRAVLSTPMAWPAASRTGTLTSWNHCSPRAVWTRISACFPMPEQSTARFLAARSALSSGEKKSASVRPMISASPRPRKAA